MKRLLRPKVLIIVLAAILIGEITIRLLEVSLIDGPVGSLTSLVVMQERRWTLQPKTTIVPPTRYGNIVYSVNSYGYRGSEIDIENGSRKIVFLGDSITFGLGANYADTFPMLVGKQINENNRSAGKFEVANLAMFAYAPAHELETLKSLALSLRPELIILQLYLNDFGPREESATHASLQDTLFVLKEHVIINSGILRRTRQAIEMGLFALLHDFRRTHFPGTLQDQEIKHVAEMFSATSDDAISGLAEIDEMYKLSRANGIGFLVMLSPDEVQLYTDKYDIINKRVSAFCEERHIPFCDPLPSMRSAENHKLFFLNGLHYSTLGHEWLSRWLLPIVQNHITPTSGPPSKSAAMSLKEG